MHSHRRPSKILAIVLGVVVLVWGVANYFYLPLGPLSSGQQLIQPSAMIIYYPLNVGTGVAVNSNTTYIDVNIRLTINSTLTQNTPVKMSAWGCMTANYVRGLQRIIVDFPEAQPLSGSSSYLLNGGPAWGVALYPSAAGNLYCSPSIGKMYFLNETTTLLSWSEADSYSPVMTAQYANGTKLVGSTDSQVSVQSQSSVNATNWEHTGYVLGVTVPFLAATAWLYRRGKPDWSQGLPRHKKRFER